MSSRSPNALLLISLLFLFGACATRYGPMKKKDGVGFSEEKINDQVFKVTFRANDKTSNEKLEGYFLRRSAEIALAHHYQYFRVIESETVKELPAKESSTFNKNTINVTKSAVSVAPVYGLPYKSEEFKPAIMNIIEGKIELFKEGEQPINAHNVEQTLQSVKL